MNEKDIKHDYFTWLVNQVTNKGSIHSQVYWNLLTCLDDIPFEYTIPMDGNRSEDGIDLRYRGYAYSNNIEYAVIERYLDHRDCSVLEMMTALAIRCESMMSDVSFGNRTRYWFEEMIKSLGLIGMDDIHFNEARVREIIRKFLDHRYEPNGRGGLFTLIHPHQDMRNVDIWSQMCWHLTERSI